MDSSKTHDKAPPRRKYLSPQMEERRHRILQAARALLTEGEGNLTINRLCERAQVSPKTVYLAYGDRDGIILAALAEHMETIAKFLEVAPPAEDIFGVLREYDWVVAELFRGPEFARVIIGYYFSGVPREAAVAALRSVTLTRMRRWIERLRKHGTLVEGLDVERLAYSHVDGEFTVLQRWATGRIPDETMADEMKANFLETAITLTREPHREVLVTLLGGIHARLPVRSGAS